MAFTFFGNLSTFPEGDVLGRVLRTTNCTLVVVSLSFSNAVQLLQLLQYLTLYSAFLASFLPVVRPPSFGLGRGPITPPGPAMVRTDRKDLNSNKTKNKISCYNNVYKRGIIPDSHAFHPYQVRVQGRDGVQLHQGPASRLRLGHSEQWRLQALRRAAPAPSALQRLRLRLRLSRSDSDSATQRLRRRLVVSRSTHPKRMISKSTRTKLHVDSAGSADCQVVCFVAEPDSL